VDPVFCLARGLAGPAGGAWLWARGRAGLTVRLAEQVTAELWGAAERAPLDLGARPSTLCEARLTLSALFSP